MIKFLVRYRDTDGDDNWIIVTAASKMEACRVTCDVLSVTPLPLESEETL